MSATIKTTDHFGIPGEGNAMPEAVHAEQAVIGALLRHNGGGDRMGAASSPRANR